MCDIDRDLVLRGAAVFATYAAERQPPKLDQFVASLIEKAIRAKLPAPAPAPPPVATVRLGRRTAEIYNFLRRRTSGATTTQIGDALDIKNGNAYYFANTLVAKGFATIDSTGRYHAAPSAPGFVTAGKERAQDRESPRFITSQLRLDRILAGMEAEPERVFTPKEMGSLGEMEATSGSLFTLIDRMLADKKITKVGKGQYQFAKKNGKA